MRFVIHSNILLNIIFDAKELENTNGIDVVVPDGVISVSDCLGERLIKSTIIKSITFSEGLEVIGKMAFQGQENLASIRFPSTIRVIGKYAFGHIGAANIYFPKNSGSINIEQGAFAHSKIKSLFAENDELILGEDSFRSASELKTVKICSKTLLLGTGCFEFCDSLECVDLKNTRVINQKIPSYCFSCCSTLSEFIFPNVSSGCINYIGKGAFIRSGIKQLIFDYPINIDLCAFEQCNNLKKVAFTRYKDEAFSTLQDSAFKLCNNLINADLSGVFSIGEECFYGDNNLHKVVLANRPEDNIIVKDKAFFETGITNIDCSGVKELGDSVFANCKQLSKVKFAEISKFIKIPIGTFYQTISLKHIKLAQNFSTISLNAFAKSGLQSIELNSSLLNIGSFAFSGCHNLSNIDFSKSPKLNQIDSNSFDETAIEVFDFSQCFYLSKINCSLPPNKKVIFSFYSM